MLRPRYRQSSICAPVFPVNHAGPQGRDGCADEDQNPGLSQPRRCEGFFSRLFQCDGTTDSSAFALYCAIRAQLDTWSVWVETRRWRGRCVIVREIPNATPFRVATFTRTTPPFQKNAKHDAYRTFYPSARPTVQHW